MYTAENAPGVAVLLSGDADVPGPLTGLPTHQDNLDTVIGRYSRLIVVGADADLGAVLTRLLRTDRLDVEVGYVPRRRSYDKYALTYLGGVLLACAVIHARVGTPKLGDTP